ncbi:MAG TPA: hypothetical protein VLT86_15215 [Vicinamibacterales bacterium]|nr:hypothetical protein [Vicinamibacterales bacterium]
MRRATLIVCAGLVTAGPASAQMHHDMSAMSPGWSWTLDAQAFLNANLQERKYTDIHQIESQNWFMAGAGRSVGRGRLMLHAMFSAEPWTFHRYGSAQVFQSGETYNGAELIDYQHPHDLVMGASARFEWPVSSAWTLVIAGGPVDAPALGPEAYPHRASAEANPTAPLAHHHLDSTHITHGVVTVGVGRPGFMVEGSGFYGREPDEDRVAIEFGPIDSYSARVSWQRGRWGGQISAGHLKFPDPTEYTDVNRVTASVTFTGELKGRPLAFSGMIGVNDEPGVHLTLPGALVEAAWRVAPRHLVYMRGELVVKDLLTAGGYDPPGFQHQNITSLIGALTIGYERRLGASRAGTWGVGGDATVYYRDPNLADAYGQPFSAHVFLRYTFSKS